MGRLLLMESTNDLSLLAQIFREDTIVFFQKTAAERSSIATLLDGYDLLAEVEIIQTFYLGLLSRVEKGNSIPEEYLIKAQDYSIFKNYSIIDFIANKRKDYPIYYEYLSKIEMCRSLLLFYNLKVTKI